MNYIERKKQNRFWRKKKTQCHVNIPRFPTSVSICFTRHYFVREIQKKKKRLPQWHAPMAIDGIYNEKAPVDRGKHHGKRIPSVAPLKIQKLRNNSFIFFNIVPTYFPQYWNETFYYNFGLKLTVMETRSEVFLYDARWSWRVGNSVNVCGRGGRERGGVASYFNLMCGFDLFAEINYFYRLRPHIKFSNSKIILVGNIQADP